MQIEPDFGPHIKHFRCCICNKCRRAHLASFQLASRARIRAAIAAASAMHPPLAAKSALQLFPLRNLACVHVDRASRLECS